MRITATVNGERQEADDVWPGESLLYVLRERMGLPGSKNACEQGECGSCTVYLDGMPVCACLVAAGQAQGRSIVTVEGLASGDGACTRCSRRSSRRAPCSAGSARPGLLVAAHDLLARDRPAVRRRGPRGAGRQPVPVHRLREDPGGRAARRGPAGRDAGAEGTRQPAGWGSAAVTGRGKRDVFRAERMQRGNHQRAAGLSTRPVTSSSTAAGSPRSGRARPRRTCPARRYVDASGCLATPGLVNTHHHLYQWATRGLAVDSTLFGWLTELYPVWARIDGRSRTPPRRPRWPGWPGPAARRPPTTTTCSRATAATCSARRSRRRARSGLRFHPTAARWTWAARAGGLPPDEVVEDLDAILAATEAAIDGFHDPSPGSMLRIGGRRRARRSR